MLYSAVVIMLKTAFGTKVIPKSEFYVFERDKYISSTAIRNDLYGNFDWLPQEVRPYFVKKVLLIGGEVQESPL